MSTVLDGQVPKTRRNNLTNAEKAAMVAAVATGARKLDVSKDYGIHPGHLSRILKDVKSVEKESNPLSRDYKGVIRGKAIAAIERGLDCKRDVYAAANIGVKVMAGIGEFVTGVQHNVEGNVAIQVSWGTCTPPAQDEDGGDVVDAEHKLLSE